jgi:hypothetical protein
MTPAANAPWRDGRCSRRLSSNTSNSSPRSRLRAEKSRFLTVEVGAPRNAPTSFYEYPLM